MTVRQALDHVSVGRSTLYRLIADGVVPAKRVGRRVLLHVDTVRALAPNGGAR